MVKETQISFNIPFIAGKERSRNGLRNGHVYQYTPKKTRANMNSIKNLFLNAVTVRGIEVPLESEVIIEVSTYGLMPNSRPKKQITEPNVFKPDVDNIAKLIMDSLNGVAYKDDSQVTELYVRKHERQRRTKDNEVEFMRVFITWIDNDE